MRPYKGETQLSGKKKQHKHKLFGPEFPRTFPTLTPECPGVKKFLPTTGAAGKRTFWCGRPRFSARTSMTRRVVEKFPTKKFALIFWPLNSENNEGATTKEETFSHFLTLFKNVHTCSEFYPQALSSNYVVLVQKRTKENKKRKTKPVCTSVVAFLPLHPTPPRHFFSAKTSSFSDLRTSPFE